MENTNKVYGTATTVVLPSNENDKYFWTLNFTQSLETEIPEKAGVTATTNQKNNFGKVVNAISKVPKPTK